MLHPRRSGVTSRARVEAYAGLLLLLIALTLLAFNRCGMLEDRSLPPSNYAGPLIQQGSERTDMDGLEEVKQGVTSGNAWKDGRNTRGWWVGHFIDSPASSLRKSRAVETKWSIHKAGDKHGVFSTNSIATSMAVLISGRHRLEFPDAYVVLKHPGDYVIWSAGIPHSWTALSHSTILCIRWPSIRDDQAHNSSSIESNTVSTSLSRSGAAYHNETDASGVIMDLGHPIHTFTMNTNSTTTTTTTTSAAGADGTDDGNEGDGFVTAKNESETMNVNHTSA